MAYDIYPRKATPDRLLLISRKTNEGRMGMVPRVGIALIQLFILVRAAIETGVRLHAFSFLMDGYKIVVSDSSGESRVSEFVERMNRYLARVFNAINGHRGHFWDSEPTRMVELLDREAALDALVETLTSAQRAGLSDGPGDWIGLESAVADIGSAPSSVARPARLGRRLPSSLDLALVKPSFFEDMTEEAFRAELQARLAVASREIRRDRQRRGLRTRRPDAIRATDWRETPDESEDEAEQHEAETDETDQDSEESRSPFRGAPALRRQAEASLESFHAAYRDAREDWTAGNHSVVFPHGTYALRRRHGARVADAA